MVERKRTRTRSQKPAAQAEAVPQQQPGGLPFVAAVDALNEQAKDAEKGKD